jgi:hypothetical protein
MIEVRDLVKNPHRLRVLDGVSLTIRRGVMFPPDVAQPGGNDDGDRILNSNRLEKRLSHFGR